jgi:hypothetical protein
MDQLGLFQTAKEDPEVGNLLRLLDSRGWLTAEQICNAQGWQVNDGNKRKIRSIAAATPKILSYPGSPGYRLTRQATADERDRAVNTLRSQSKQMDRRALDILNEHRFGSPTTESELFPNKSAYASGL